MPGRGVTPGAAYMAGTVLLIGTAPALASAQGGIDTPLRVTAMVETGAAYVDFDEFLPAALISAGGQVRIETARSLLSARGALARYETGHMNVQGGLTAAAYSAPFAGALRGELSGSLAAGYHETIGSSSAVQGTVRVHATGTRQGGWVGAGLAWSAVDERLGTGVRQVETGAWMQRAALRTGVVAQATFVDAPTMDVVGLARWTEGRLELGAQGGLRIGALVTPSGGPAGSSFVASDARTFGAVDALLHLRDRLSLVGAAGRSLADPVTRAVGGSFVTLGLRLASRGTVGDPPRVVLPSVARPERATLGGAGETGATGLTGVESLRVDELPDGRVRLVFTLPGARTAELNADFTDWEPVSLELRTDGRWELIVPLSAGVHRVNVRVDGGAWRPPPDLTAVPDGFGGRVGLLVVRR